MENQGQIHLDGPAPEDGPDVTTPWNPEGEGWVCSPPTTSDRAIWQMAQPQRLRAPDSDQVVGAK